MATPVKMAPAYEQQRRVLRNPEHKFQVRHMPWQIQPFMIAPVLPGETMQHMLVQARVVSDPIKNPLIGWWSEYYFFYAKLRDLDIREDLTDLMVNPDGNLDAHRTGASSLFYHSANGVNFTKLCLDRVVSEYFRNEGEGAFDIGGLPVASIGQETWLNSVIEDSNFVAPDVDLVVGGDDTVTGSELEATLRQWMFLKQHNLVEMDYNDWLRSFGVSVASVEEHRPELLRYMREWTYPTNTVDPATGAPSSAVSWAIRDRIDKRFAFLEPGFIFGVTVARPKVYLKNATGSLAHFMDSALSWLPAMMHDDAGASLKKFADNAGPLAISGDTGGYWVDVRDLFIYGDQYVNFDLAATDGSIVALPTADLQRRYVVKADIDGLFKGSTDAARLIRQDGVCSLSIRGRQVDRTPLMPAV